MRHIAALLMLALLVGCAAPQKSLRDGDTTRMAAISLETLADGAVCRVGPDGGLVALAKHAGTTSPALSSPTPSSVPRPSPPATAERRQADRGIGGTGVPAINLRSADNQLTERGIGGTGIVGVITGFASICVDGLEVAYDGSAAVDIDGSAATPAALRAGQMVVIQAKGPAATPVAQTISVRRQVTGRVESIELGTGTLTIAGQAITIPPATWGADVVRLGDWVAVSGMRRSDGMLIASRLDLAPAGTVAVRGQVVRDGDTARVGGLVLSGAAGADLNAGQHVMVSGHYAGGRVQVHAVTPDPLFGNPAGYFGPEVDHLVLQGLVRVANGAVFLNGMKIAAGQGVSGKPGADGVAIVSLERRPDGSFTAVGLRYVEYDGVPPGAVRAPAGISHGPTMPQPPARPSLAQMMALTGNGSSSSASASAAAAVNGLGGISPVVTTRSTGAVTNSAATTPASPVTVADALPTSTPPRPVIILSPKTIVSPSGGSEANGESVTSITSQLMSNGSGPASSIMPVAPARLAFHPVIIGASTASATVSLSSEAVTTPPAQVRAGSVKPLAALAPPASRSRDIKPIGTQRRSAAIDDAASQGH